MFKKIILALLLTLGLTGCIVEEYHGHRGYHAPPRRHHHNPPPPSRHKARPVKHSKHGRGKPAKPARHQKASYKKPSPPKGKQKPAARKAPQQRNSRKQGPPGR